MIPADKARRRIWRWASFCFHAAMDGAARLCYNGRKKTDRGAYRMCIHFLFNNNRIR